MKLFKAVTLCLIVGLIMGFVADFFLRDVIKMSAYVITIPAAFVPFVTGALKMKEDK